ncbi:uncharacterized protein F4807DRAFT_76242 [Annulohypoxylon truncatum]|uniref:uncharacterized protein n=1 Tax=Annulohypoxylon truncatum TaxID=327061 RepID=UPI00200828B1|nr:uncharacterized protein F4807DRAFT_76242 [Annulohypoxylon truncatum]KAI1209860.1 hypothetical protein F4807DRAFT_76242 [Annulohypoxylon truncatum]
MDPLHHRTSNKDHRGCCYDLKSRDGWFKGPRNTAWTIDSTVNGKSNPSGYDSNTLITILRWSQFFTSGMTLILYVFTLSAPKLWLTLLASVVGFLSCLFSIFALYLRHRWAIWLAIPEILITIAWIVLLTASSLSWPPDSKAKTFQLGMIAIEASMVLWIQTFLLAITPAFHRMLPRLFGVKNSGVLESHRSMNGSQERVRWPMTPESGKLTGNEQPGLAADAAPMPGNYNMYPPATPSIVCPQPTRRGPAPSDIELQDYLVAQGAGTPTPTSRTLTTPHRSAAHSTPYAGSIETTGGHLGRTRSTAGGLPPLEISRGVSPASVDYVGPIEPVSPLSNIDPWSTSSVRGGDARRGF